MSWVEIKPWEDYPVDYWSIHQPQICREERSDIASLDKRKAPTAKAICPRSSPYHRTAKQSLFLLPTSLFLKVSSYIEVGGMGGYHHTTSLLNFISFPSFSSATGSGLKDKLWNTPREIPDQVSQRIPSIGTFHGSKIPQRMKQENEPRSPPPTLCLHTPDWNILGRTLVLPQHTRAARNATRGT